jgi:hypothetical protein
MYDPYEKTRRSQGKHAPVGALSTGLLSIISYSVSLRPKPLVHEMATDDATVGLPQDMRLRPSLNVLCDPFFETPPFTFHCALNPGIKPVYLFEVLAISQDRSV